MKQEKINYDEIMALGFTEDVQSDKCYEAEHGYAYCIITLQVSKKKTWGFYLRFRAEGNTPFFTFNY